MFDIDFDKLIPKLIKETRKPEISWTNIYEVPEVSHFCNKQLPVIELLKSDTQLQPGFLKRGFFAKDEHNKFILCSLLIGDSISLRLYCFLREMNISPAICFDESLLKPLFQLVDELV